MAALKLFHYIFNFIFKTLFILIFTCFYCLSFSAASIVETNEDLFPIRILCEDENSKIKINNAAAMNEKRFIINSIFIEFNPMLGGTNGKNELTAFTSYDGFLPKNYWNNITFKNSYVAFGNSKIFNFHNGDISCRDNYDVNGTCNLSNPDYVSNLPNYITTSTDVYIQIDGIGLSVKNYGLKINRESLIGEYKYNSFYPDNKRNGFGFIQCKLFKPEDKKPNYLNIWNKYQELVKQAFERERKKNINNKF